MIWSHSLCHCSKRFVHQHRHRRQRRQLQVPLLDPGSEWESRAARCVQLLFLSWNLEFETKSPQSGVLWALPRLMNIQQNAQLLFTWVEHNMNSKLSWWDSSDFLSWRSDFWGILIRILTWSSKSPTAVYDMNAPLAVALKHWTPSH